MEKVGLQGGLFRSVRPWWQPHSNAHLSPLKALSCAKRVVYKLAINDDNNSNQIQKTKDIKDDSNQDGFRGPSTMELHEGSGFNEPATVCVEETSEFLNLGPKASQGTTTDTIATYMARWEREFNGTIAQRSFPIADFIKNPTRLNKLRGSVGFKGTFGLKIVWNSEPLTSAIGLLAYVPPGALSKQRFIGTPFLTGCPHVVFNFATHTSAELFIPYVGESPYVPLDTTDTYAGDQLGGSC